MRTLCEARGGKERRVHEDELELALQLGGQVLWVVEVVEDEAIPVAPEAPVVFEQVVRRGRGGCNSL